MTPSSHPFPIGAHVLERAYPKYARGVVTGHAPDGWTFVKWDAGNTLSHPPRDLALVAEEMSSAPLLAHLHVQMTSAEARALDSAYASGDRDEYARMSRETAETAIRSGRFEVIDTEEI